MAEGREPIAVIGTGYVGLVTAAGFSELGNEVWCVDIDAEKIKRLNAGEIPIYEPGLKQLIEQNRERLHFSTELAPALEHARLLFVAVGTPPTYSGDADLSAVHAVVNSMPQSNGRHALVMKSTVPSGTGESIKRIFTEQGKDFLYVSCPEFLKEGSAVKDFLNPDRVVVGDDGDWAGDAVVELYAPLDAPLVRTDIASAEMIKLASNAFLATKISFINEIANVCEETGADVDEVARGMGLDERIGSQFLKAGIGFGGSCLVGDESVLVRFQGNTKLLTFEQLFELVSEMDLEEREVVFPSDLEVLAWRPSRPEAEFLPVSAVTRRSFSGQLHEIRTKMGRRLKVTPDHPFIVADRAGGDLGVKLAEQLSESDWLPIAQGSVYDPGRIATELDVTAVAEQSLDAASVIVRPAEEQLQKVAALSASERDQALDHSRGSRIRLYDVVRSGTLRLDELKQLGLSDEDSMLGTVKNGTYLPARISIDESFWRVVGLYLAEGHCGIERGERGTRYRLQWSFHPTDEMDLVELVRSYWDSLGVKATVYRHKTTACVTVSSRLLAELWLNVLNLGRNCYEHRIPDLIWEQPESHRRALLSGLWLGDGSWSYIAGGPSVVLEYGTVSRELADGMLRLLGDLGVVARLKVGRTAKSTVDTYWLVISGANQIERVIDLVPEAERRQIRESLARQAKRIAPTGYRKHSTNAAWVRTTAVKRTPFDGHVYSLEVPDAGTFVTTAGLVVHNCFPKDVNALKQLAGNSGYHFQLLNAVIEVNELQKRRVISKLQKHLGSLVGRRIALLGLAFKPDTDDMREASSLVLSARLQADGAHVASYDPIAEHEARKLLSGIEICDSVQEAIEGADAVVLVTEWQEFTQLDWQDVAKRMSGTLVVDGRNFLDPVSIRAAGLTYEGIGRPRLNGSGE